MQLSKEYIELTLLKIYTYTLIFIILLPFTFVRVGKVSSMFSGTSFELLIDLLTKDYFPKSVFCVWSFFDKNVILVTPDQLL